MGILRLLCVAGLAASVEAAPLPPRIPLPLEGTATTRPEFQDPIPRQTLQEMYRAELGDAYDPIEADQLYEAHQLIERFFDAHSAGERKSLALQLEATRIDPNVLGRLTRIRMRWPTLKGGGVFYVNQKTGPYAVRYFLGVPKTYDRSRSWPLVIRLPGASAFLTNPPPDAKRVVEIHTAWAQEELARHGDAIVMMPLLDLDELYGPSYTGMNSVIQPMLDSAERVNIDPARVYMVGHSMAAHAVWNLALHYPTFFAAVNPLAGSASADWQRLRLMNLLNVLPVVWHDDDDKVIKVGFSKSIVNALRELKVNVDFDETRGVGHTPSERIAGQEYEKLRGRVRSLYPEQVWLQTNRPDVPFNRNDWVQIYQELETGKERHLFFKRGTGHMTVYANSCSIKATAHNNQIDVASDNVESMRFYLNDQLVNLAEPVTVVVNRKQKFRGVVKSSVAEMLNDQLFLGRGWRYYSGAIDILMTPALTTRPSTKPTSQHAHKGTITVGPAGSN